MSLPELKQHDRVYGDVLDLIHDTPLVELGLEDSLPRATLWGKLESVNPGGSVKDRICLAILRTAEATGQLKPGGVVVEPTSGNTGIGLALVCRRLGYRCILTMPESMSLERRALLESLGAELELTPETDQMVGAIARANELAAEHNAFMPRQFDNPANPAVHQARTGPEIVHALGSLSIDAFVAGIGTGGTVTGVGRYLKQERPSCRVVAVEPESCPTVTQGKIGPTKIQGWAPGFVPTNFDRTVVDEVMTVSDADSYHAKLALAKHEGLLVGISSGGAVRAALEVAKQLPETANVVVLLPDTGERYFSLDEYFV